ncbi:MAG: ABC transporter ATP-binding protein, partial [Spirochaeta sp.]|nr:ABC transporter ATP-binding protein [Spirochaeta sp.]
MAEISIRKLTKKYGGFTAVSEFDLSVADGEFLSLLGPSGCGKTTLLRSIAGFFRIDQGEITIGDRVVSAPDRKIFIPPENRNLGMVFQSYAVWPHMNVFDNIAYPLKVRHQSPAEIKEKVERVVELLNLAGQERKNPAELSGGQQQRVALGRALVMEPDVLLLDEPLSNL